MRNRILCIFVCMLFITVFLTSVGANISNQSIRSNNFFETLYVGGSGPGNYSKIQDAIDNASYLDTVFVYSGTYDEHIIIDKPILVVGQNKENTIIDGHGYDTVLITVNFVRIKGFTIEYGGSGVIVFDSNDCKINDNIIRFNDHHGVYTISSLGIQISENTISNNVLDGINYDMSMMGCIANNIIADNGQSGLYLDGNSIYNEIFENKFLKNQNGIGISGQSGRNRYYENIIKGNSGKGVNIFQGCIDNWFFHNDFIKNGQSACDRSINKWDDGEKGNFWDDYDGKDLFPRDGIGDTPYIIPGGKNQDNYPLMEPYNTVNFKQFLFPLFLRVFNRFVELIQLLDKVHIKLEH